MRNAFAKQLHQLAKNDPSIVLLSGDIGNRLFDDFKAEFPGRFFNCGVAEANMMSMAAGMAMTGARPVVYTITPFVTTRCLEQIRVDVCYHRQPVVIVGVGAGLSYAGLGATHHACEDIAFLRVLPGMTVICPADPVEVRLSLSAALSEPGPVYLRLGKKGEPTIHIHEPDFEIGRSIEVRGGSDVAILSVGTMLPVALDAATKLEIENISACVISFHTVKPLDGSRLREVFREKRLVVTLEEHSILGGAGGAVAEWRCDQTASGAKLLRLGCADAFLHEAGGQTHARSRFGLDADSVARSIAQAFSTCGS